MKIFFGMLAFRLVVETRFSVTFCYMPKLTGPTETSCTARVAR